MKASEIRRRFLDYFQLRGHELRPSGSLVPADDPTLLFTNAGMVPFKRVFLGQEEVGYDRAVTSQKCVRAGGKHNDLEEVGRTARHHTFFEMLGNFSFGDYFKRDAIHFAWDFLTSEMGLAPDRLYATVHHTDDEAHGLWRDVAGLAPSRIFRLGDRDNFWQMADTGPCGPCSELHYDLRPDEDRSIPDLETFEALGQDGRIVELWNLVFMQFDRDGAGTLHPLPAPSIDTGLGLERLAAVLQRVNSNYHTDLFIPLLDTVARAVGRPYQSEEKEGVSYRVLADHSRAVAFLLADGVFPSNEGRGYVLRRILRRGVRHAWLLGRREPTLVPVVEEVVRHMGGTYPELLDRKALILQTTRIEEERFLSTIEGGMARFEELASEDGGERISGDEAFKLYDTFGFPLDLTQLMAREQGVQVDVEGFEEALARQRARSRADREASGSGIPTEDSLGSWALAGAEPQQRWVGWERREVESRIVASRRDDDRVGLILDPNPFYAEAGGQVSDTGTVEGAGWRVVVDEVRVVEGLTGVFGTLEGEMELERGSESLSVIARVDGDRRHDIERNHTATHLLHAALREILGEHVSQRGSLVAPDRLRFDFSHPEPLTDRQIGAVEDAVNRAIWSDHPVAWEIVPREEATKRGAMALFGEKYGDEVRMVKIPGLSLELCGGTHLRHTGAAGLFKVLGETGVASGVRRIEAATGRAAYRTMRQVEEEMEEVARLLRSSPENLQKRTRELLEERESLKTLLEELRRGGGGSGESVVHEVRLDPSTGREVEEGGVLYRAIRLRVRDADDARSFGDAFRDRETSAVGVLASETPDGSHALFVLVTDDLIGQGVRAGDLINEVAALADGRGGGRPHMAQGGVGDPQRIDAALIGGADALARALQAAES